MTITELLEKLNTKQLQFKDVLAFIEEKYDYSASAFQNGAQKNSESENQGSAKVLSFAKLKNLSEADTLTLFAEHYASVLATPEGVDHKNIREFQLNGWKGVSFEKNVLTAK